MASNFNWEDIGSNSLAELKRETNKLGINIQPRTPKKELVKILENHKSAQKPKTNPTYINPKLLMKSPNDSQTSSKNNSTRESPIPQRSAQKQNNISPRPEREERKYSNNVINTPQSARDEKNVVSSESTFQQQEKRELSPVAPSSSEKRRPHSSHKKTPSSHTPDERKVHYSNSEHPRPPSSAFHERYVLPKNITICFYILAATTIIFSVAGVFLPPLFIFAFISGILLYVVKRRQNQHLEKMSRSLGPKIISYLKNDCDGKALKSHLKEKFNADTQVMRRTATFLKSKKRIQIRDKSNKDQVWTLISSPKN